MSNQPPSEEALKLVNQVYAGVDRDSVKLVLVTMHRRENLGQPMENISKAILELAKKFPNVRFVFPVHLNPAVQKVVRSILSNNQQIHLCKPLDYDVFAYLMKHVYLVLTDSGGIQEEATAFSVPILVLRKSTERPEAVEAGMSKLVGSNYDTVLLETSKLLEAY
jgi:UDP-N-acetylglucosamine 2-epimerase (non-hydrolysing)